MKLSCQWKVSKNDSRPSLFVGVVKSDNSLTNLTTFRLRRVTSYLHAVLINLCHQYLLNFLQVVEANPARVQFHHPVLYMHCGLV
ncbi:hypothetical protein BCR33DRAFT_286184 [Rhizoclosmatium globosum]|uniref:Uncharacterized protein n=1 Tax=Rhizoclosmatium globosum TaxID=329046 RepID=A0A1Y2C772_9FUNG|nr:hypothetical protein BCR33DRAFT_286184 [Rhizoclosmatium globosum]|eukprot:ORY42882.1 hypothetical protein BCR33DRAFT_286184 [Rhizoclosmatium globosum]